MSPASSQLLSRARSRLRLGASALFLLIPFSAIFAAPCEQLKAQPEVWVKPQVNALVLAAYAWYERDSAERAYDRVLDRIENIVTRCALTDDAQFRARYPEFLD